MCLRSFTVNMLGSHGRAQGGFPILLNVFAYICFKCQELSSWLRLIRHHFCLGGRLCVWQKPLIEATQLRQTYGVLADPTVRSSSSCRESRTSHNYLRLDKMIRERLLIYVRPRIYNLWCILSSIQRKNRSPDSALLPTCQSLAPLDDTREFTRAGMTKRADCPRLRKNLHFQLTEMLINKYGQKAWHCTNTHFCMHGVKVVWM